MYKTQLLTRSDRLLELARPRHQGSKDVLDNARRLSIPIKRLDKLLNTIKEYKQSPRYRPPKKQKTYSKDFIKIETR